MINGKVYCGGETSGDDKYIVYCYDPLQDEWTTLPPLPVERFGLGQVNGKLVAVGGCMKGTINETNEVYTYVKRSQKWKRTIIPPMPTARWYPSVLSLQSALLVAGGYTSDPIVDIFKLDISQWYRADPLPRYCYNISLLATRAMH